MASVFSLSGVQVRRLRDGCGLLSGGDTTLACTAMPTTISPRKTHGRAPGGTGTSGVKSADPTSAESRIKTGSQSHRTRAATTIPDTNTAAQSHGPSSRSADAAARPPWTPAAKPPRPTASHWNMIASTAPRIPRMRAAITTSHSGPSKTVGARWSPTAKPAAPTKSQKRRRPNRRTASPTSRVTHQLAMAGAYYGGPAPVIRAALASARDAGAGAAVERRAHGWEGSDDRLSAPGLDEADRGLDLRADRRRRKLADGAERARLGHGQALDPDRARRAGAHLEPVDAGQEDEAVCGDHRCEKAGGRVLLQNRLDTVVACGPLDYRHATAPGDDRERARIREPADRRGLEDLARPRRGHHATARGGGPDKGPAALATKTPRRGGGVRRADHAGRPMEGGVVRRDLHAGHDHGDRHVHAPSSAEVAQRLLDAIARCALDLRSPEIQRERGGQGATRRPIVAVVYGGRATVNQHDSESSRHDVDERRKAPLERSQPRVAPGAPSGSSAGAARAPLERAASQRDHEEPRIARCAHATPRIRASAARLATAHLRGAPVTSRSARSCRDRRGHHRDRGEDREHLPLGRDQADLEILATLTNLCTSPRSPEPRQLW